MQQVKAEKGQQLLVIHGPRKGKKDSMISV